MRDEFAQEVTAEVARIRARWRAGTDQASRDVAILLDEIDRLSRSVQGSELVFDTEAAMRLWRNGYDSGYSAGRDDAPVELESGSELCESYNGVEHVYLSTGCFHGEHGYCKAMTGQQGEKRPGRCKFCDARCVCSCHGSEEP